MLIINMKLGNAIAGNVLIANQPSLEQRTQQEKTKDYVLFTFVTHSNIACILQILENTRLRHYLIVISQIRINL